MQAQHYASTKMDYLVYNGYGRLSEQQKEVINDSNFKDEVVLGNVSTNADGISYRTVTINVYSEDEVQPRAKLQQVFYSNDANRFVVNGSSNKNSIELKYEVKDDKLYAMVDGEEKALGGGTGWKPPDYSSGVVKFSANESFVCPSDGVVEFSVTRPSTSDGHLLIYVNDIHCTTIDTNDYSTGYAWMPCVKGDRFKYSLRSAIGTGTFYSSRK